LNIKDPAFYKLDKKQYSFYFGRVYVRALVRCQSETKAHGVCGAENIRSKSIQMGIKSVGEAPTALGRIEPSKPVFRVFLGNFFRFR
jgi:hypothetical protein